ncbi:unnamed protein product [Rhizopus stolonifer]
MGLGSAVALNSNGGPDSDVSEHKLARQIPTHIIKLKASAIPNKKGFLATSFVSQHFKTFQRNIRSSLKGKHAVLSDLLQVVNTDIDRDSMKNINIGKDYKAVTGSFPPQFVNYLSNLNDVEFVEQNQVYKAPFISTNAQKIPYYIDEERDDPTELRKRNYVTQLDVPSWGIARINHRDSLDLTLYTAEELSGAGIHVYILDSGIQENHPDFDERAQLDANFINYETAEDYSGHGTHVAGIIGGNIFGVAKKTILHGVKILDRNGDGTTSALLQAISHIAQTHVPGRSIVNLSLSGPRSQSIDDALSMLVNDHNIPVFVSAGNTGDDACDYSPSANPDVFAVGASDIQDNIPPFSSFGSCVSLYAPGTNITSTWIEDSALTMDGTSMANPHVSGIAAMLMTERTFQSTHDLYNALKTIATPNILTPSNKAQGGLLAYNGPNRA